ncbi:hypothetical protein [Psychromicrobium sp. YIM B11713]|uniref:hypothetical protein n=1 Tax=Psychromicrobium sp. YIM B11713 TaxID=3145233 RepID=UPI00374E6B94
MSFTKSFFAASLIAVAGSALLAAPAQAATPLPPYTFVCTDSAGVAQDWNGLDPYSCVGWLDVYDANGQHVVHVKDGAKSDEPVDCTLGHSDEIISIYTPTETIGYGLAAYIWDDSWIVGTNCLAT